MKIRIRKRPQIKWLTLYIFALPFAFFVLMDLLHFPSLVKYTIDVAWVLLFMILLLNRISFEEVQTAKVVRVIAVFLLVTIVGFVLEYQSILYYLWGLRNNMRFFVFFIACVLVFDHDDADSCMGLMDKLFGINFIATLYQYFGMNISGDFLGGIFGVEKGCNAYTNIFLAIIAAWHILRYMSREEQMKECIVYCMLSLLIAALAELKMFFIEFAVIVVLASLLTRFSVRKVWIFFGAALCLFIGIKIVEIVFPEFANWFTLGSIYETAVSVKGYTYRNDMNRLTAISISWNDFLNTWPRKLFGLGLGNCDYASGFDFLTTPFYRKNRLLHYTWFSSAFMILETGLIGLLVYGYFFVRVFMASHAVEKRGVPRGIYCQMAMIMSVMSLILIIYNSSMRMECAYMVYFVLAMPFMKETKEDKKNLSTTFSKEAQS